MLVLSFICVCSLGERCPELILVLFEHPRRQLDQEIDTSRIQAGICRVEMRKVAIGPRLTEQ